MKRFVPLTMIGFMLLVPAAHARTVVVTDASSEKSVTLSPGDTLVVRLTANETTGYSWNVVYDPNAPLALSGKPRYTPSPHPPRIVGVGGTAEFRFTVPPHAEPGEGSWLRLLYLQPFSPGLKDAKLWEIKYVIKAIN